MDYTVEKTDDFQRITCCQCSSTLVILLHEAVPDKCPACEITWEDESDMGKQDASRQRK